MFMSLKRILTILITPVSALSLMGLDINEEFQPAETFQSVGDIGTVALGIIFSLGAIFTLIYIVMGGIKFITSDGEPNKVADARKNITFAVIGMVVMILTFVIMYTVQALFINNPNL